MFVSNTAAGGGYQVQRSVRLRASASAWLSRTPASAGNRRTWTWSGWVKRGALDAGGLQCFFSGYGADNNLASIRTNGSDQIQLYSVDAGVDQLNMVTSAVFRDPSAHLHLVWQVDTTQAAGTDRVRLYVNGVLQALVVTQTPAQNSDLWINNANAHALGRLNFSTPQQYFDGYLSEINFIDGQALDPSAFGYFDPVVTNWWRPKKYTGSYGTNGFCLPFSNGTSLTTLGADASGNGNNWTLNNASLTAGATYDWMLDVPWADGGDGRGNYATLNPLLPDLVVPSEGNLKSTSTSATIRSQAATISVNAGKWVWEVTCGGTGSGNNYPFLGAYRGLPVSMTGAYHPGGESLGFSYQSSGPVRVDGTIVATYSGYGLNDTIRFELDLDNLQVSIFKNSTLQGTVTVLPAGTYTFGGSEYDGSISYWNFGQRPFSGTPSSGFKAPHTGNLPTPTGVAANPRKHFDALVYSGNGATKVVTGSAFQPDLVWIKSRSNAYSSILNDAVRGVSSTLSSDSTLAEQSYGCFNSFNADGFTVDVDGTPAANNNGSTFASWLWKAGGAPVTNTAGSIPSQVSANVQAGFSIVTYTGTGANATVGHGLGVAPKMVIVKTRSVGTYDWCVYHSGLTSASYYLPLNGTTAQTLSTNVWNATAPTSSVISIGTSVATNTNAGTHVAYCFAEVPGYSKFGSYTGNGLADGPFVYCGFRPRYVLWKCSSSDQAGNAQWGVVDAARNSGNVSNLRLNANASTAEDASPWLDITANGFKVRESSSAINASGGTYIFMAFAEAPFQYANAR